MLTLIYLFGKLKLFFQHAIYQCRRTSIKKFIDGSPEFAPITKVNHRSRYTAKILRTIFSIVDPDSSENIAANHK